MVELYAPEIYMTLSPEDRARIVNGCGPGGWKVDLVPDTIYGLDVSAACDIHDFMYTVGTDLQDKEEADRVLLNNILRLIEAGSGCWLMRRLRRNRARIYYEAVEHFGGPAFWSGKNPTINLVAADCAGIRG